MNTLDVVGFKKGLAAILEKFQLNSLKSSNEEQGGQINRFEDEGIYYLELINLKAIGAHPGKQLRDVVEVQEFYAHDLVQDLCGLLRYYGVESLSSGDQHFNICFDDGGKFELNNITIIGESQQRENDIQSRES
jgi:hypothetical protein